MTPNLYTIIAGREPNPQGLTKGEFFSLLYHNLFDYPLNIQDMIRWRASDLEARELDLPEVRCRSGYYFLAGKEGIVYKRIMRKRISEKKMRIAEKSARVLSVIPWVKMIAVTGSLAMKNSSDESDIDLMVITQKGTLWTTRLLSYLVTWLLGVKTRKPGDKNQKDRLCLNMWLDECNLVWRERNFYTAHEIAQIVPLVNKDRTYEKFLDKNKWILNYWPNSVRVVNQEVRIKRSVAKNPLFTFMEQLAFSVQYQHMKPKITREVVTKRRALFHPQDWSKAILARLV